MAFEKIIAPTPKELFLSQVIRMILSGELKPGEWLPTERRLSELMGVNRSTVHRFLTISQKADTPSGVSAFYIHHYPAVCKI